MQPTKNNILIGVLSIVAIFGFLSIVYLATNTGPSSDNKVYTEMITLAPDDHIKWSKAKKHILVEYSDLQCPACKAFHDYIKPNIESDKNITDKITFVFRHYPLIQAHQYAQDAAYAAEAAGKQGKFFEMTELMYDNQDKWEEDKDPRKVFEGYAKDLKLDVNQFRKDRDSNDTKTRVLRDMQSGNAGGVPATPTFFLDGKRLDNVKSYEEFKQLLQDTAKK